MILIRNLHTPNDYGDTYEVWDVGPARQLGIVQRSRVREVGGARGGVRWVASGPTVVSISEPTRRAAVNNYLADIGREERV